MCFRNIFSHSVACILIHLSIFFSFMDCAFGFPPKNLLPSPKSARYSPMLFYRSFRVSYFTIRSVVHFEIILAKSVRSVPRFSFGFCFGFCMWISSCNSTICCKNYFFFSIGLPFLLFVQLTIFVGMHYWGSLL